MILLKNKRKYGLGDNTFFKIINVFNKYSRIIDKVILFGSRARGDFKSTSDIDLAIKFRERHDQLYKIIDELSQLNIIYTFDVVDYDKISNERLKDYINIEGVTIFQTNPSGGMIGNMNKIMDKLDDLEKAIKKLKQSLERDPNLDDLVLDATIQRFEFTYELSWKLMKIYLEYNGLTEVTSPRRAIKEAYKEKLITEGESWLRMLEDRNKTSHTYDEEIARKIFKNIRKEYINNFDSLLDEMKKRVREL